MRKFQSSAICSKAVTIDCNFNDKYIKLFLVMSENVKHVDVPDILNFSFLEYNSKINKISKNAYIKYRISVHFIQILEKYEEGYIDFIKLSVNKNYENNNMGLSHYLNSEFMV